MKKVIIGGIAGAVIVFIWGFISWELLPWYDWVMNKFENEEFVSWVIQENTDKDGVYVIPAFDSDKNTNQIKRSDHQKKPGPFVYAQIKKRGIDMSHPRTYIIAFLTQFVGAALISFLLLKTSSLLRYGERLFFVVLIGLLVGILGYVPDWNWLGGGTYFLLITVIDLLISWFLAGLVLAAFVHPKARHQRPM